MVISTRDQLLIVGGKSALAGRQIVWVTARPALSLVNTRQGGGMNGVPQDRRGAARSQRWR